MTKSKFLNMLDSVAGKGAPPQQSATSEAEASLQAHIQAAAQENAAAADATITGNTRTRQGIEKQLRSAPFMQGPVSPEDMLEGRERRESDSALFISNHPAYGVPAEVFTKIGTLGKLKSTSELRELEKQYNDLFAELGRYAKKGAEQLHREHLEALGRKILAGEIDNADGWSVSELAGERDAKIQAFKSVLKSISVRAHEVLRPMYSAAAASAKELLARELAAERVRFSEFGLPYEEPSEVLRSIRAAQAVLEQRAAGGPPVNPASPSSLVGGLFQL